MTDALRWRAVLDSDPRFDGTFYYAVTSTGIFCRPSCPSRPPRRDRVRFFPTREAALTAGFRPCKRCRPDLADFSPGAETAAAALDVLQANFRDPEALETALDGLGISRRRLSALFREAYGTTLSECLAGLRTTDACRLLRETALPVTQVAGEAGFGSPSSFYRTFHARMGCSPSEYRTKEGSP